MYLESEIITSDILGLYRGQGHRVGPKAGKGLPQGHAVLTWGQRAGLSTIVSRPTGKPILK